MLRSVIFGLLITAVAGCGTPYQDMGFRGGVEAQQMTADTYRIKSRGNAYTARARCVQCRGRALSRQLPDATQSRVGDRETQSREPGCVLNLVPKLGPACKPGYFCRECCIRNWTNVLEPL